MTLTVNISRHLRMLTDANSHDAHAMCEHCRYASAAITSNSTNDTAILYTMVPGCGDMVEFDVIAAEALRYRSALTLAEHLPLSPRRS